MMNEVNSASLSGLFRMALVSGPPTLVLTHLRRGANVNARDADGVTPLMLAMARGRADICKLLLDEGADPRLLDQAGRSALAYAQSASWTAGLKFSSLNGEPASEPSIREPGFRSQEKNDSKASSELTREGSSLEALDLGGWESETISVVPIDNVAMRQASSELQSEIARHRAINHDPNWFDIEVDLPTPAPRRVRNPERLQELDRLRTGFRRALAQGRYAPEEVRALLTGDFKEDEGARRRLQAVFDTLAALGLVQEDWADWRLDGSAGRHQQTQEVIDEACEYFTLHWSSEDIVDAMVRRLDRYPRLKADEDRQAWRRYDLALQSLCAAIAENRSACAELAQGLRAQARQLIWAETSVGPEDDEDLAAEGQGEAAGEEPSQAESPDQVWSDDQFAAASALLVRLSQPQGHDAFQLREAFLAEVQERRLPGSLLVAIPDLKADAKTRAALAAFNKARDVIFESNSRLSMWLARRYGWSRLPLEDRFQEASLGLMRAIDRFDPRRGNKFSSYAVWWVRQSVTRAIADLERVVRLPVHLQETLRRFDLQTDALTYEFGREPTTAELAVRVAVPEERLVALLRARVDAIALDGLVPASDDERSVENLVDCNADPERGVISAQLEASLGEVLLKLSPREERILRQRSGLKLPSDMTLEEIGAQIEVTRERIRQIEAKALRRLFHPAKQRRLRPFLEGGT